MVSFIVRCVFNLKLLGGLPERGGWLRRFLLVLSAEGEFRKLRLETISWGLFVNVFESSSELNVSLIENGGGGK